MKRIRSAACMLLMGGILFAGTYGGGSGIEDDPYIISSKAHLLELSQTSGDWDTHFEQTANITFVEGDFLDDGDFYNGGNGFSPIGNLSIKFTGSYNGQGHTIDGLFIDRYGESGEDCIGLFGYTYISANIHDLHMKNVDVTGNQEVGGLIGTCMHSTVKNCSAEGSVTGFQATGGLIGKINKGNSIDNCYSKGSVTGITSWDGNSSSNWAGGLAGVIMGDVGFIPSINNSYSTSDVSGAYYTGGLSGIIQDGNISYSYCIGSVTHSENSGFGGFTGSASGNYTVTGCFWNVDTDGLTGTSGGDDNYGATGKTTSQMKTSTTFTGAGWDFEQETTNGTNDYWDIDDSETVNSGYPFLSWESSVDVPLPITLASFSAEVLNGTVHVSWVTESETENAHFLLYRDGEVIATLDGAGTTTESQHYNYADQSVIPGKSYRYILADVSIASEEVKHKDMAVTVNIPQGNVTEDYSIGTACPNPFNPVTVIPLNLATEATVTATLYDINGRPLQELQNGTLAPGSHDLKIPGAGLSTGVYVVHVTIDDVPNVQKVVLMK